jgi:Tol biopolymer transport system component
MSEQDISTGSTRANCRVFISYSHDSIEHAQHVLELAERLRKDGVDAQLDQYVAGTPSIGWPRWMLDQLDWADFVLMVCTETYYRRFRGHEEPGKGKGADWEGNLITLETYDAKSPTTKFVPVLFDGQNERFIPEPLRAHTRHLLNSETNYTKLYAFITGQAGVVPRKLGPLKTLAREPVEPLTFRGPVGEAPPAGNLDRLPGYGRQKTGSDALGDSQSASAGNSLTIKDNRLLNFDPPILAQIPYKETPTVDELTDRIRISLTSPPKVPDPGSYGRQWILYSNGRYFHEMGRRWAQFIEGKQLDQRPLREVGINPGMTLEVQPPKQAKIIVNPRPFLGAGAEILQFVYAELRDVGGFINRIQNWIPELSVESYGTRWVLYDPATGRYFDDIVKGDSRVLWTAGIPNEDGDTFLDVRPPPPGAAGQVKQANVWRWWNGLKTELKVAVIGGLFAIVVAIVTGIGNLVVATYNGAKVSPAPSPSPTITQATPQVPAVAAKTAAESSITPPPATSPIVLASPAQFVGTIPYNGDVTSIDFSPDGTLIATGGGNNYTAVLWNASTGKKVRLFVGDAVVASVAFNRDGTRLATDLELFDVATGERLARLDGSADDVKFSPDGRFLATASGNDFNLGTLLFDQGTGKQIRRISGEYAFSLAFSPDSKLLATATGYLAKGVRLWSLENFALVRTLEGPSACVAFSPDGKYVATAGDGMVRLFNPLTGEHLRDINGGRIVAFSPVGRVLATVGDDSSVRLYDPANGNPIRTLEDVYAKKLVFSPDGERIATLSPDGSIQVSSVR